MTADRGKVGWRAPALGAPRELDLARGRVRVFESGDGPPRSSSSTACWST
jgi:hypothetical protein